MNDLKSDAINKGNKYYTLYDVEKNKKTSLLKKV